jgi:hypothetical protein
MLFNAVHTLRAHRLMPTFFPQFGFSLPVFFMLASSLSLSASVSPSSTTPLHKPDEVIGTGSYSVRRTLTDPVTLKLWAGKHYRLLIYQKENAIADYEGLTDSEGRTLTLRFPQPIADTDVVARPVIGDSGYKAAFQFVKRDGSVQKNQGYLFSAQGRFFMGQSDDLGQTAEVRFGVEKEAPVDIYSMDLSRFPQWQSEAESLNKTLEAKTPQERIALVDSALASSQRYADSSVIQTHRTEILKGELADALSVPASLSKIEEALIETEAKKQHSPDGNDSLTSVSAQLDATIEVMKLEIAAGATPDLQSSILQKALALTNHLPQEDRSSSADSMLYLCQFLLDGHHVDRVEDLLRMNGTSQGNSASGDEAQWLAIRAQVALQKRERDKANELFSLASFVLALDEENPGEADTFAALRKSFPLIGRRTMLITPQSLADLRGQCVEPVDPQTLSVLVIGKSMYVDAEHQDAERTLKMAESIDALLTHGTLSSGSYLRNTTCEKGSAHNVTVTEDDLKRIRDLRQMQSIVALKDAEAPAMQPEELHHFEDALGVYLQHAQLTPGTYEMNKTLEKFHFSF